MDIKIKLSLTDLTILKTRVYRFFKRVTNLTAYDHHFHAPPTMEPII